MKVDFDYDIPRNNSDSLKWLKYGPDVLPLWVADMDFASPKEVVDALHARIEHGVFGYGIDLPELKETVCERLRIRHQWAVQPKDIVFLPGLVSGLNVACRAVGQKGDSVLVNTPVYPPFLSAPGYQGKALISVPLASQAEGKLLHYEIDFDRLEESATPQTKLYILCNPQNPTGRVFTEGELNRLAEFCHERDIIICSDEIHCDLILSKRKFTSFASLSPEIGDRTITLLAPSKTFNIPGLGCSMAVVTNPQLRARVAAAARGIVPHTNTLGMHAALAAYKNCDSWLESLLKYLQANRDFITSFVETGIEGVRITHPEATYLSWMDISKLNLGMDPQRFLLKHARVALTSGRDFGPGGEGFVRLNYGCTRSTLRVAMERIKNALESKE